MAHSRSHPPATRHSSPNLSSYSQPSSSVFPSFFCPSQSVGVTLCPPTPSQILLFELNHDGLSVPCAFDQFDTLDVGSIRIFDAGNGVISQSREDPINHGAVANYEQQGLLLPADETTLVPPSPEYAMDDINSWLNIPSEEDVYDAFSSRLPPVFHLVPDLKPASPLEVGNWSPTAPPIVDSSSQNSVTPIEAAFPSGSASCTSRSSHDDWESLLSFADTAHSSLPGSTFNSPPTHDAEVSFGMDAVGCRTAGFPAVRAVNDEHEHGDNVVEFRLESQDIILDDGFIWRKYGEKKIKNRRYPRSYFKCAQCDCPIRKQIERSSEKEGCVLVRYKGKHTHPA